MKNISKKIQYLFLIGAMCMTVSQKAMAFGFLPPLPPDFVVDFPGGAGKIGSNVQAALRQYQTYMSQLNTFDLDALKGMLGAAFNVSTPKSVGRGDAKAAKIGNVTIEKGSVSETDYFNAYNKLFFEYPPVPGDGKITSTIMRTAYKHKGNEYLQDIIIDTYVTGRITEDYMALVEKTIERLGRCQDGSDTSNCEFFGMKFSDVPAVSDNAADGPGDDKGQLGVATNGYIITTMYDRLLRIIEDLTATEAIYRAAKQNSLVRPVSPQSSAEDYVGTKYHFAYHQTNETSYAKKGQFISTYSSCEEDSTRPGCAKASHEEAKLNNMASAEILGKLQQIDQWQQEAMILHNLKVQLPNYKSQYRKYLKAKEIHEQTLLALKKSDECAKAFIKNHAVKEDDPDITWDIDRWKNVYGYENMIKANNQYKDRKGISAGLIADYELAVNETIMGTDGECSGYYKECPSGYVLKYKTDSNGNEVPVTCDTNKEYYACTMQMVTMDSSEVEDDPKKAENFDSSEFMQNGSDEDRISAESRIKAEKGWRIGRNRLMALTEANKLKFNPWNDQKSMQASYLRKKYNNIKTIISSTDDAFNSFKIAASRLTGMVDNNQYAEADATINSGLNKLVQAASRCISPASVTDEMIKNTDFCNNAWIDSQHPCPANVVRNVNEGTVTASKTTGRYYDEKKRKYVYQSTSTTWHQIVSNDKTKCDFRRSETSFDPSVLATTSNCPKSWDLTPSFLIKHYFGEVNKMGGCKATLEGQATNMRNVATNNDRVVAWDKLADVIDKKLENEATIKAFVKKYNDEQNARKNLLTYYKKQLDNISTNIDKATKIKNAARKLKKNAESRIENIAEELAYMEDQKNFLESRKKVDYEQMCSNEVQQYKLKYERAAINGDTETWKTPDSCANVRKNDKTFSLDLKEVAGLSTSTYIMSFEDAYDTAKDELIKTKGNKQVKPSEVEPIISKQNTIIDNYKITRDEINKKIEETQEAITVAAQNFASPSSVKNDKDEEQSYIVVATDAQEALDESNNNFEKFVGGGHRMQRTREYHCYKPLFHSRVCEPIDPNEKDNLEATMVQYIYGKGLEDAVRQGLEETWTGDGKLLTLVSNLSSKMNVPTKFVVDESFLLDLGIPAGVTTTAEIVKKVRDTIVEYATTQIAEKIRWSDSVIEQERADAVQEVETVMNSLGLSDDKISENNLNTLSKHAGYGQNKDINDKHNQLIKNLRRPKYADAFSFVNRDMSSIWGIPDNLYDEGQFRDSEYFVAKPARGVKYLDNAGNVITDSNAGRDFKAPQEPLMNLPPLREVFYFNSLDYDDMPRNGDVPTLTNFMNLKYSNLQSLGIKDSEAEKWEYLPQVWLYLLARPNTRNDGGFQQTFIEDSYGDGAIQDLINGSDHDYNAIIGRGGVYPCKLSGFSSVYKYIDVAGGNGVGDMRFYKRKTLPSGVAETECLEIEAKNGITHVLADHVKDDDGSLHDYQDDIGTTDISAYNTHSELGQMFRFDDNKLKYRALQANIQEFLLDSNNSSNNINRRKAEAASFKRNIFGSFLEMVNFEHNAKKNLDTAEKNVKNSLKSLCNQIHAQKVTLGYDDSIDNDEACVKVIMEHGGLASSASDKVYGESGEYDKVDNVDVYAGVARNNNKYYDKIYYLLEDAETKLLDKAMNGAEAEAPKKGEDPIMCGTAKNRHCGYKNIIGQFSQLEKERVQERLASIVQFFNAFNGDEQRVVYLSPDRIGKLSKELLDKNQAKAAMESDVKNAKADRTTSCESDDRSIISMDSQNKSVPYCPIYAKEKVN